MYQQLVVNDELHSVIEQVYIACDDVATKEIVSKFHDHQQYEQQYEQHEHHHEELRKGGKGEEEEEDGGLLTKGRSPFAVAAAVASATNNTNNSSRSFVSSSPSSPSSSPTTMLTTTGSENGSGEGRASSMHIDVDPSLIFNNNSIISPCSGDGDGDDRCHDGHGNDYEDEVEVVGDSNHEGYDDEIHDEDSDVDNDDDSGGYSIDEINHLNKYSEGVYVYAYSRRT